ncbi:MAG TPA: peptidoglycan DD-metalloendopeptidase family protein [Anaerolineales bacterium]|nr:peptidoglycan DD-metalloendopeptidase family protein [Anaerolineales bacterium]
MIILKRSFIAVVVLLVLAVYLPVSAQGGDEAYYIVQEGDALWSIAARFGVSLDELQQENNITDPSQVGIGARLVIPGLQGISGELDTITVSYSETLRSLSRRYGVSEQALARLNRLVSPSEVYAGVTFIVPKKKEIPATEISPVIAGQSLLESAVLNDESPWKIAIETNLSNTWSLTSAPFTDAVTNIAVEPLLMTQGGTTVVKVQALQGITLRGLLADRALNFFPLEDGYVALQGIHAMLPPGLYPLELEGELPDGERFAFSQNVLIQDANFPYDPSLQVDPATIDPAVTIPEQELWESLGKPVTTEKMWDGIFAIPVPTDFKDCWTSFFGTRRSYNGGTYDYFHSGLDFCGRTGTELYAVAPGKVVYVDTLVVRGGVIVIDHGWGVYTAYDHLSEFRVQVNDLVQPGQVIGLGGSTGRSTGPHLHWEVWVGGVQVNPVDWLARAYP